MLSQQQENVKTILKKNTNCWKKNIVQTQNIDFSTDMVHNDN